MAPIRTTAGTEDADADADAVEEAVEDADAEVVIVKGDEEDKEKLSRLGLS